MNLQTWQNASIDNPYQNIGQSASTDLMNNLSLSPTTSEFNRTLSFGGSTTTLNSAIVETEGEPLFGTHIREAATTVKKLFSR